MIAIRVTFSETGWLHKSTSLRAFLFVVGLAHSINVQLVKGNDSELFEGRTIILSCVNGTINQSVAVWYKNDQRINTTTRNLTLTLRRSDTGIYKCEINERNSANNFNLTVKGMSLIFCRDPLGFPLNFASNINPFIFSAPFLYPLGAVRFY